MYPFPRRAIQQRIYALRETIGEAPTEELVRRLNEKDLISFSAVWEAVLIYALSRLGSVDYETGSGRRKPDVRFTSDAMRFSAEVTTVSDRTAKAENPIEDFMNEVYRLAHKLNIPGSFHYLAEANRSDVKVTLKVPKRSAFQQLARQRVRPFLREIINGGLDLHALSLQPDYHLVITYERNQRYSSGSHPSFTAVTEIERNPLWNALDKKREHLSACAIEVGRLRGIFACNCGCDAFRSSYSKPPGIFDRSDIVRHFLRKTPSIDFVVLMTIEDAVSNWHPGLGSNLAVRAFPHISNETLRTSVEDLLRGLCEFLPRPMYNIETACHPSNIRRLDGITGGVSMSGSWITISARVLLQYLAGELTHEQFLEQTGLSNATGPFSDPFRRFADAGRLIDGIQFHPTPEVDDDRVTIRFGLPDPAAAAFRLHHPRVDGEDAPSEIDRDTKS